MSRLFEATRRIFPWLLLAPLLLPLVIGWGLEYPYLVTKTLAFYALGLLSLGAFAILAFSGEAFYTARLKNKLTWIPGILLILAYVSSLFGVGFYHSFWGLYIRGDGLLTLTLSIACFYFILLTATEIFFKRLLTGVSIVGIIVAIWGILEWFISGGRVESSIGNAAFLAGYLDLALFVTLARAQFASSQGRWWWYGGAALEAVTVILTATRGTMLALAVGFFIALIFLAYQRTGRTRTWALGLLGAAVILAGLFFAFRSELTKIPFGPLDRIAQTSFSEADVASRLFIWQNMLGEIGKSPLLGYGAEHVDVLFNRFYDPSLIYEQWFDRSHNAFFDYAAQFGLGGLLLYLALIGSFLYAAYAYTKKYTVAGEFLMLLVVTYVVQNFFIFDTISSWWLLLALLGALFALTSEGAPQPLPVPRQPLVGGGIGIVMVLLIVPCSLLPLIANANLASAYYYTLTDPARSVSLLKNGFALSTYADLEYGYTAYQMYTGAQAAHLTGSARLDAYTETKDILLTNYNRYSYDARTALFLAHLITLAPPEVTPDLELERAALERGIALSPKRAQIWYLKANLSIGAVTSTTSAAERTQKYNEAISVLKEYRALVPHLAEPHYVLAELYHALGDTANADKEAALGKQEYTMPNLDAAHRAVGYYETVKDWPNTEYFLASIHEMFTSDLVTYYDLAKAKYLNGKPAEALAIVKEVRAKNPAILTTDPAFLSAITTYEQSLK